MAIHGKQLKDASIDLTKLEGISATPTQGQLLVAGANGSMQALNVGGNLTSSVSGSTLDLSIAAGTIQLSMIDAAAIVSESEGIGSNDNDTTIPTSAAVKDYVDTQVTAQVLDLAGDTGTGTVDLDSQALEFTGGDGIDTSASGKTITLAIDSTVATLTGSQTLTNKTLTSVVLDTAVSGTAIKDEDDMLSDSATHLATQQSIKAYVDAQVSASGSALELTAGTGSASIALATETLSIAGGDNISTVASSTLNSLTVNLDPNISLTSATLSGALSVGTNATVGGDLTVSGDLTVNGTTTTVNSTTVTVDDKNLELGSVATPTDTTADGGGITLKGATDKTFNWVDATDAWTSSEHMDLASSKSYRIAGTELLAATGVKKVDSDALQVTNSYLDLDANNRLAVDSDALITTAATALGGNGLGNSGSSLFLDLNELNAADVNVAADSIAILDADGNSTKKESIEDLVAAMAGTGLTSSAGQINLSYVKDPGTCVNQTAGSNIAIAVLQADYVASSVSLSINGIEYPVGTSSTGYWHIDNNDKVQWNSETISGDFLVDSNDTYILSYFKSA